MENKKIEKSCTTCEFNFGNMCAGYGTRTDNGQETYGMPMEEAEKMFPTGCADYGISLDAFVEQEKMNGRQLNCKKLKGRRGVPVPGGDRKWVERKINAAKDQLVNTLEQYSKYEIPQFMNGKGDKCTLKIGKTYIGIIILYNEAIEDYKRIVSCKRIDEQFQCFTYNDFKVCCEKLVIPRDIIEYLEFRKKIIQSDKMCSADEELMAEEFLCGKYGTSNLNPHELDTFRWFLKTYQSR